MTYQQEDEEREEQISMEIIVDSYGPEEQVMGWYCYLERTLLFSMRMETPSCRSAHMGNATQSTNQIPSQSSSEDGGSRSHEVR